MPANEMAGGDLADIGAKPHILIGVDPALTVRAWHQFGGRPFVFAFPPLTLGELANPVDRFGEKKVCPFPAEQLVGHFCYNTPHDEVWIRVQGDLERARRHFGLPPGAPLRTAVAGNHSSMCIAQWAGHDEGCTSLERLQIRASLRERKLVCVVGAALERMGGLELVRLPSNIDSRARAPEYDTLVKEIRKSLDEMEGAHLAGFPKTVLKLPTAVRLYTRRGDTGPWERLKPVDAHPDLMPEADWLLQTFLKRRIDSADDGQEELEGVLLKILGADPDRHSPADTPMITLRQMEAARDSGLKAILLDARWGIVLGSAAGKDGMPADLPIRVCGA